MVLLHIFQGGLTFSSGGGGGVQMLISIETHNTITCDFLGGLDPLLHVPLWFRTWTMWHFGTNGLLLSFESPNANRSIVLSD